MLKKLVIIVIFAIFALGAFVILNTVNMPSRQTHVEPVKEVPIDAGPAAERLSAILQFKTISTQDSGDFDAEPFLALIAWLEEAFPLVHSNLTKEVIGDYSLLYKWEGSDSALKPILLMSHIDVVPIEPGTEEDWTHPPFSGAVDGGYVWGRGAMDVKSGVGAILEAVEHLIGKGFEPKRSVYLAFGHDEEIGGYAGNVKIVELLKSGGVRLEFVLDEGGSIFEGLLEGIEQPVAMIDIAEKGYLTLELSVETDGGHSSMPPKQTAVGILSAAIHRLEQNQLPATLDGPGGLLFEYLAPEMGFFQKMAFANRWLFGGIILDRLSSLPTTNALIRTTTAATMFSGSVKENILPIHASAAVNFRIVPGQTSSDVIDHVKATIDDPRVAVAPKEGSTVSEPSSVADIESKSFQTILKTVKQVFPEVIVVPGLMVAATDSRHYQEIADNIYRFIPGRITAEDLPRIHGTNERVSVKVYTGMIRFFIQLIKNSDY